MSEGGYSTLGARLVQLDYAALPVMKGAKRPGEQRKGNWIGLNNWREEYTRRKPSKFEMQLWAASGAGVGIVCGPASKHLVAIDIDSDDPKVRDAIVAVLPPTRLIKRGAKGETRFYRGPDIVKSPSWNLPYSDGRTDQNGKAISFRACDLLGAGRFTVLPPTTHPDTGQPYTWIGGAELENFDYNDIPLITPEHVAAIGESLKPFGWHAEPERPQPGQVAVGGSIDHERPVHRQLNDAAIANYDAWVPRLPSVMRVRRRPQGFEAVAVWRASNSGQEIAKRKLNLKFDRGGIVDFGDGPRNYTPLNVVMAALDLDLDMAFKWLSDALGWNDAAPISLKLREPSRPAVPAEPRPNNGNSEDLKADDYDREIERLTHCPGLVGDTIDWIVSAARQPNRVMALGAAVTTIGTLIGRRVAGPTRSATHLYVACIAPTGSGKQHPIDCQQDLMRAAGAAAHIGPSEFMSMTAVINLLVRQPLSVMAMDELGDFLKRINDRKASGFERNISKLLRSMWGINFKSYSTPEWAGRASVLIAAPALSFFGLSTPKDFFDGLKNADLTNGMLNRCLVINAGRVSPATEPMGSESVPPEIASGLAQLFRWGGSAESLSATRLNDYTMLPTPIKVEWASEQARRCYSDFANQMHSRILADESVAHFMARTAEIAVRLATIRAVGRWGPSCQTVDLSDIEWGRDLALTCGERLSKDASVFMAENERQMWSNKILTIIRDKGQAKPRDIQRALRGALKSTDIRDHLNNLEEAELIEPVKGEVRGRMGTVGYKFKRAS